MKLVQVTLIALLFLTNTALTQNCPPGSIELNSQDDVDNFLIQYPNCTEIQGDLIMQPFSMFDEPISNLSALSNIDSIHGTLVIQYFDPLQNLAGLENLDFIGGDLKLEALNSIPNLNELQNLTFIGGNLEMSHLNVLQSFSGLENLFAIGGELYLSHLISIQDLSGLEGLMDIGGNILMYHNKALKNLAGLEGLTTINANLTFHINDSLQSLQGLENITHIEGNLAISGNDLLLNLSGLEQLTYIGGDLWIWANYLLEDLFAFENLTHIGGQLDVVNNAHLSDCHGFGICFHLANGGAELISGNASGCYSDNQVLNNCDDFGKICHPIFYDLNENGLLDNGEPFYAAANVIIDPMNINSYGNFQNGGGLYLPLGDYTVSYDTQNLPDWELITDSLSYTINLSYANLKDTVFFGIAPTTIFSEATASLAIQDFRCNTIQNLNIYAVNTGTNIIDGTVWIEIDNNIDSIEYIDVPDTIVAPNLYGWHFNELLPGGIIQKELNLHIPGPPDITIGDVIQLESYITFSDLNGTYTSDSFTYADIIDCAYDPNDKLVNPVYPSNYALVNEPLIYTIRFQNTGNAEAYDVVIRDTLDAHLNSATFRVIASSHDAFLSTQLEDNQFLSFNFIDINLPDSTTNFEESQGYVMYSIQAFEDIEEGTELTNSAGIYFDQNPPIITNTVLNKMVFSFDVDQDGYDIFEDCDDENPEINPAAIEIEGNNIDENCDGFDTIVSVDENLNDLQIRIAPNPTSGKLSVNLSKQIEGALIVKDLMGHLLFSQILKKDNLIDLNNLTNGLYLLEIKTENGVWVERLVKTD